MSDDWQVGDLALCLKTDNNCSCGCNDPALVRRGQIYVVASAFVYEGETGLTLEGVPEETESHFGINAKFFRKIKPDAEPCEEEFVTLIKRMKPAKVSS